MRRKANFTGAESTHSARCCVQSFHLPHATYPAGRSLVDAALRFLITTVRFALAHSFKTHDYAAWQTAGLNPAFRKCDTKFKHNPDALGNHLAASLVCAVRPSYTVRTRLGHRQSRL